MYRFETLSRRPKEKYRYLHISENTIMIQNSSIFSWNILSILCYILIPDHNTDDELVIKNADVLSSPGFPSNYPDKILQKYYLKARRGFKVIFVFIYFQVEYHYDFVKIYDGYNISSPLIADLTGVIEAPHILSSTGNKILFVFRSDFTISKKGFKVIYRQVELNKTGE